jgi:hypothetical protein
LDGFQSFWRKVFGFGTSIQFLEFDDRMADVVNLSRGGPMLDVVSGREVQVPKDQVVYGYDPILVGGSSGSELLPVGLPLGDQPSVFLVAFGGTIRPEIPIFAVDRNNGAIPGSVETVARRTASTWHGTASNLAKTVHVPFFKDLLPSLPITSRYPNSRFRLNLR